MEHIYKPQLLLEPQPEGGYTISCPLIPGMITGVDTWAGCSLTSPMRWPH